MKIKSIRIQNFQSLGDVNLELKDLTILWGPSDIGKSACVRAIKSLHRNTMPSTPIRYGITKLRVTQEFEDGQVVSFEKSKTINSYIIGDKTLAKIGRDVPDEVKELLKTDKLILDKDQALDLSFAGQFDGTFLLSDSTSVVTKTISSLSGIHYIYSALREASAQAQKIKSQNQLLETTIEGLKKYEELNNDSVILLDNLDTLQKIEENIKFEERILLEYQDILNRSLKLSTKEIDTSEVTYGIKALQDSLLFINNTETEIKELQGLMSSISAKKLDIAEELAKLITTFNILKGIFLNIEKEETGYNELVGLSNKNSMVSFDIEEKAKSLLELVNEEILIKSKIKICETCGRTL